MTEKYCVAMPGVKKKHKHEHDTIPVLLEIDQTLAPIRLFNSIDEAVKAAIEDKKDHPKWNYEVRQYLGNNTDMLVIEQYGRWKIGEKVWYKI